MDFCLSKKEERMLWEIYKHGSGGMIVGDCSELFELEAMGLVVVSVPGFNQPGEKRVHLTEEGRRYIRYYALALRRRRQETRRYWIATAIALAALLIAVISLEAQLH